MAKDQLLFNYSSAEASEQKIRAEQERLKQLMDKFSSTVDGTKAWWVGDSRNSFVRQADEFSDLANKINDIILYLAESLAEAGRVKKEEDERLQKELLDAIAVDPGWVADVEERSQARAEAQQTEDQADDETIQGNEKISFDDFKIIPDRPPYPDLEPVEIRIDPDSADLDDVIPPVIETDTKYVDPDNTADPDSIQMRDAWDDGNEPGSHVRTIFESRSDVEKVDWERTADGKSIITITFNDGKPPQVLVEGEDYYIKDDNAYLYNNVRTVLESSGAEIDYKKNPDGVGSTIKVTMPSGEVTTLVEGKDYEIGADGKAHFLDETHGSLPPGAATNMSLDAKAIQDAFMKCKNGGDFDGACGLQCVDLSRWFIETYTTLKSSNGNGCDQAKNTANVNGLQTSSIPKVPAVYSVAPGYQSFGSGGTSNGHTGIVLSIDEAKGEVTVIHTGNKLTGKTPNSWISTYKYPAAGVEFTYLGDNLKT